MRGSVAALLGACLCVAFATLATKPVLGEAPALPVVLVQVATSLAAIGGVAVLQGRWPRIRRDWRLALPGLLQPGLSYGLMFAGLALIPASVAGLLFATEAALVALAAWPLLGERPSRTTIGSILASTLGVALLAGAGTGAPMVSITGVALVLAGIICAAMDTVAARALAVTADPLTMAVATHLGALIMIVASLCFFPPVDWRWLADSQALTVIAAAGIALHGIATVLFNIALQRIPAATAAAVFPTISLLVAFGGVALFGEQLAPTQWLGGVLLLAATLTVGARTAFKAR